MKERANSRQSAQDKAVIDHLTSGAMKPEPAARGRAGIRATERDSRRLQKAIQKAWTPSKGGLPTV
jgi:hypothetical protein